MKKWKDILSGIDKSVKSGVVDRSIKFDGYGCDLKDDGNKLEQKYEFSAVGGGVISLSKKRYYLFSDSSGVYLTAREAQCVYYMLHGYTILQTAKFLNLSNRTIEFYLRNMKLKMHVSTKSELILLMIKLNVLKKIGI